MNYKSNKAVRESGVELLRILSTLAVIVLHIRGGWETTVYIGTVNYYVYWIIEVLCAAAVNCFLLITGYFSLNRKKFSLWKPFELYLQLIICREVIYIVMVIVGMRQFTMYEVLIKLFPTNYYVTLYIGMILLAPYINKLVDALDDREFKSLIVILLILISIWPTIVDILMDFGKMALAGANTISSEGAVLGQTLMHFIFVYFLGCALKKFNIQVKPMKSVLVIGVSNIVLVLLCFVYICNDIEINKAISYSNPLLLLEAGGLFLLFKNISFHSKVINVLAKGSFMTYILHGYFLSFISIENVVNENIIFVVARTGGMLIITYLICSIGAFLYEFVIGNILKKIKERLY